jgi:hypothetical protein
MTKAERILDQVQALGYGSDTEDAQLLMLNQVHRRILNARRWTFLLTVVTKTTEPGKEGVTFESEPVKSQRIDAVRINEADISPLDLPTLRQWTHDNPNPGRPEYWAHMGGEILFYPIPDQEYVATIDAVANPLTLTSVEDNVQVPDSHVDILTYGIIMQLTFRERDWDGHNFARQMYAELFTEMLAQYGMKQRQQSDRVTNSGQWDNFDVEEAWPISAVS